MKCIPLNRLFASVMANRQLPPVFQNPAPIRQGRPSVLKKAQLLCFLSVLFFLQAQAQYIYRNYSTINGLPSSTVYSCLQDSAGFIWFATATKAYAVLTAAILWTWIWANMRMGAQP